MKTHETLAQQEFVARQLRRRQMVVLARLFLFLSVLVLWEACARTGVINAFIFSSPSRIVRCFFSMVLDGSIFLHTGVTILETLVSFFFVTAVGILGAVALWSSKSLAEILDPYLVMLNSLPKSALAPILIVWLGSSMRTIVAAAVSVAEYGHRNGGHRNGGRRFGGRIRLYFNAPQRIYVHGPGPGPSDPIPGGREEGDPV